MKTTTHHWSAVNILTTLLLAPLWSFAWLDLIVRDEIADAARSEADPWVSDRLELNLAKLRDRRLKQVLQVHRSRAAGELKLAKSARKRPSKRKPQDRTG